MNAKGSDTMSDTMNLPVMDLNERLKARMEAARRLLTGLVQALGAVPAERVAAYQPEAFELAHLHARLYALDALYGTGGESGGGAGTTQGGTFEALATAL